MDNLIAADDPRFQWAGAISTEVTRDSVMPWRIPFEDKELYATDLVDRAAMPAGVRLQFRSDTAFIEGHCDQIPERSSIDLMVDGEIVGSAQTAYKSEFYFDGLGAHSKLFELWLPQFGEFRFKGMKISAGATVAKYDGPANPRWITYGSSISQCRAAESTTLTWPSIVARTRKYDLTCLGFGGQCHLDPMVARVIRDTSADMISLCLGINVYGSASLNSRTFGPGIIGFVKIIREKHPDTPIALMSPIYSPGREDVPNDVGFTIQQMRTEVLAAAEKLRASGDETVHYINGLDVLGSEYAHLLPDDLHPDTEGYAVMARNLLNLLPVI
jgi:hypothetical protein